MKREMLLVFAVLIVVAIAVNVHAQENISCAVDSDCYPADYTVPEGDCGNFFYCQNSTCQEVVSECSTAPQVCANDTFECPDGSIVSRNASTNCSFDSCSSTADCVPEGGMCGGIAGFVCCSDLTCELEGDYPDAAGACVSASSGNICEDKCGDGVCDSVVCQGEDCPCAETADSCSADCKSADAGEGGSKKSMWYLFIGLVILVFLVIVGLKIAKWLMWSAIIAAIIFVLLYVFVL